MQLWREYLEQYADKEGDVEGQILAAAYNTVRVLTAFSRILDGRNRYKELIDRRAAIFDEGGRRAAGFAAGMMNAAFSIYNNLNTLSHQLAEAHPNAAALIAKVDEQARRNIQSVEPSARPAVALRACFPLLSLITITLDQNQEMTETIRQVEQRYAAGARAASTDWEHLLNALYRMVEMIQILALITDSDLKDQVNQIASRFKEEDLEKALPLKLRNGFCRLFELTHLLANQVDTMV